MESVLLTGGSGFLGRNILPALRKHFPQITTLGRTGKNDIAADLAKDIPNLSRHFDLVIHAAGKAHAEPSANDRGDFLATNLIGTQNLCRALEKVGTPKSLVFISSVAVYGCEQGIDIDENQPLKGTSPYAASKIKAEEFLTEWCKTHGVTLTILRPSLIAAPNPPGNLGRMIRSIKKGRYFEIFGNEALKSLVMAEDIAELALLAKEKGGIYNACATTPVTFRQLSALISAQLHKRVPMTLPRFIARVLASIGDVMGKRAPLNSNRLKKITSTLTFSNRRATERLGWEPRNILENFIIEYPIEGILPTQSNN